MRVALSSVFKIPVWENKIFRWAKRRMCVVSCPIYVISLLVTEYQSHASLGNKTRKNIISAFVQCPEHRVPVLLTGNNMSPL